LNNFDFQQAGLNLPAAKRVCNIDVNIDRQTFYYDDEFSLLLNNYMLASSKDFDYLRTPAGQGGLVADENGFFYYNWAGVNGVIGRGSYLTKYCLKNNDNDSGSCTIPLSERSTPMEVDFHDGAMNEFMQRNILPFDQQLSSLPVDRLDFSLISYGDDDRDSDCRHSGINIRVNIDYIE
jgi:hypothetical protein